MLMNFQRASSCFNFKVGFFFVRSDLRWIRLRRVSANVIRCSRWGGRAKNNYHSRAAKATAVTDKRGWGHISLQLCHRDHPRDQRGATIFLRRPPINVSYLCVLFVQRAFFYPWVEKCIIIGYLKWCTDLDVCHTFFSPTIYLFMFLLVYTWISWFYASVLLRLFCFSFVYSLFISLYLCICILVYVHSVIVPFILWKCRNDLFFRLF